MKSTYVSPVLPLWAASLRRLLRSICHFSLTSIVYLSTCLPLVSLPVVHLSVRLPVLYIYCLSALSYGPSLCPPFLTSPNSSFKNQSSAIK